MMLSFEALSLVKIRIIITHTIQRNIAKKDNGWRWAARLGDIFGGWIHTCPKREAVRSVVILAPN
jgi:hypothetical protein